MLTPHIFVTAPIFLIPPILVTVAILLKPILFPQYDCTARALADTKAEVQTWLGANSLITEQKSVVEADLLEKTRQVERNEKIIEELYGDIHHLRDDVGRCNTLASAKESEFSGGFTFC